MTKNRKISFFELDGDTVWGATGRMIREFLTKTLNLDDFNTIENLAK